jgi:hypothetical protein
MSDQKPEQEPLPTPREDPSPPAPEPEEVGPVATFPAGRFWEFTMPMPAVRARKA